MPATEYFPAATPGCPSFADDSEWYPIVDGAAYFAELDDALRGLGAGDSVQIAGLQLWSDLDLRGRRPGEPGHEPLGGRLVALAAAGVQVRVLLAGELVARWLPVPALAGFRDNVAAARALHATRATPDSAAPLAGCVIIDWSGAAAGSNHQKVVVVDRGGEVTAYVSGIDLVDNRVDAAPHDRLRLRGRRWGWHDAAARLRGPAAGRVHDLLVQRWHEAATLPPRYTAPGRSLNPWQPATPLDPARPQSPRSETGTAVRVLRSAGPRKVDSALPWRRRGWTSLPAGGVQEVFGTLTAALAQARHYVYLEDQYLGEALGGRRRFELYPALRAAARRGVRVVLVGSGVRDPEDPGIHLRPINRTLNRDLRRKLVGRLDTAARANLAVWRIEHCTVHAKLVLIDDAFACIGSANMFSRSMSGVDSELSAAVSTTTSLVRDLRVQVWGEHLQAPVEGEPTAALNDPGRALGLWRPGWAHPGDEWTEWSARSQLRPVYPAP